MLCCAVLLPTRSLSKEWNPTNPQPKQIHDIKKFLEIARRKDATCMSAVKEMWTMLI
jgi:hypothetical protein